MFSSEVTAEITSAAARIGIEPEALLAVAEIESGGVPYAEVDGKPEPLIRFEGHYFDKRLSPANQVLARSQGLSSPTAGAIANPPTQPGRWALLRRAAAIDPDAAYESVSWGLGQVMGAHWQSLGFASVGTLVDLARRDVGGQAEIMARFIQNAGLGAALNAKDWSAFARGYNGPLYARSNYDGKVAEAYRRYKGGDADEPGTPEPRKEAARPTLLCTGTRGEAVRDLQTTLTTLGYGAAPDGIFGAGTERALKAFQRARGLGIDGIAGPATFAALDAAMRERPSEMGVWRRLWAWVLSLFGGD